jgi:ribosome-binding protein aMBF1 (putative translation factor)
MKDVRKSRKARLIPASTVMAKAAKKPGFAAADAELEDEFSLIHALIKARVDAGLTQDEVAKRMDTSQAVIARLESGGRSPSTRTLHRFAEATGTKLQIRFEVEKRAKGKSNRVLA